MRDTIDMALEAGWDDHHAGFDTRIDRLVALVRADERALAAPVQELKQMNGKQPPAPWNTPAAPVQEPVAFKIYKPTSPRGAIPNVQDAELPWVYDQDPSSGNVASMWVTPVKATPPAAQRQWVGLTRKEVHDLYDSDYAVFHQRIEAKLKEKNT